MAKLVFGATVLFALVHAPLPLQGQGSVSLNVCNAGEVDIDVLISQSGKVSSSHIGPADCAFVAQSVGSMGRTYVGLAFVDAQGKWGAARRQDLLPFFGDGVLDRANQSVPVPHGNTTVSLPMQLLFQPPAPICHTSQTNSAEMGLPLNATRADRAAAQRIDSMGSKETICDRLGYKLNVLAYADSREITFKKFCDPCDKKAGARITPEERAAGQRRLAAANQVIGAIEGAGPFGALVMGNAMKLGNQQLEEERKERRKELAPPQRVNWHDMREFLSLALPADRYQEPINRKVIVQGTVASVELPRPGASVPWVNVYFTEAPNKAFNITTSSSDIFQEMFGPDFSSRMIGKMLEVEGEATKAYCSGGCIRLSLSRQVRLVGSGAGMVAAVAAPNITFRKPVLTPEGEAAKKRMDEGTRQYELERQRDDALRRSVDQFAPQWIGQYLIIKGTISRVQRGRGSWVQLFFEESPDGAFAACFAGDLFNGFANSGADFQGLVGKTVELRGRVAKQNSCGARTAGLEMTVPTQISVSSTSAASPASSGGRTKGSATGIPRPVAQEVPANAPPEGANPLPLPAPGPSLPTSAERATSAQPAAAAAATPQMRDLSQRYADLVRRSAQAKAGLAQIERQLASQRLGLRIDIVNARTRVDTQLRTALVSIDRADAAQAEQSLRYAEAALGIIETFLGR